MPTIFCILYICIHTSVHTPGVLGGPGLPALASCHRQSPSHFVLSRAPNYEQNLCAHCQPYHSQSIGSRFLPSISVAFCFISNSWGGLLLFPLLALNCILDHSVHSVLASGNWLQNEDKNRILDRLSIARHKGTSAADLQEYKQSSLLLLLAQDIYS